MAKPKLPGILTASLAPHVPDALYVGIDQSYTGTGVVAMNADGIYEDHTLIQTSKGITPMDEISRITGIFAGFHEWTNNLARGRKVCVVMEDFAFSQANQMAALGGLGWHIRIMLSRTPWHFAACGTGTLKKCATGSGNGDKSAVMLGVYKRWTFENSDNNVCDAYVLSHLSWVLYRRPPMGVNGVKKDDLDCSSKIKVYR
jgi:Holliday junction resolvasome RuvABC endonuclease subunit